MDGHCVVFCLHVLRDPLSAIGQASALGCAVAKLDRAHAGHCFAGELSFLYVFRTFSTIACIH